jgi:hypothetical protein
MAQSFHLREQAERCRRLARDSTDPNLRDSVLKLAQENDDTTVWQAGSNDQDD